MNIRLPKTRLDRLNSLSIAATLVERSVLAKERPLLSTKWFAYRFLPPLEATMLFAEKYNEALRDYVATNVDISRSTTIAQLSLVPPTKANRQFTQLWIARQEADQFPIPYELYLEFCFMFASRRRRRMAPRPNQLRPTVESCEVWFAKLEEFLEGRASAALPGLSRVAQYDVRHFRKLPAQVHLQLHLADEMRESATRWPQLIEQWSLARKLYPLMSYRRLLDNDVLRDALAEVRSGCSPDGPSPPPAIHEHDFWQSCFGVPGTREAAAKPCCRCPQTDSCVLMASLVERQVVASTGHVDPRRAARRENQRKRTERFRLKRALSSQPRIT